MSLVSDGVDPRGFLVDWQSPRDLEVITTHGSPSTLWVQMRQEFFLQFGAEWNANTHCFDVSVFKMGGRLSGSSGSVFSFTDKLRAHFAGVAPAWRMRILKDNWVHSRSLCVRHVDTWHPVLTELVSPREVGTDRCLHMIRLTGWPNNVDVAMNFQGRGWFDNGRWAPMQAMHESRRSAESA